MSAVNNPSAPGPSERQPAERPDSNKVANPAPTTPTNGQGPKYAHIIVGDSQSNYESLPDRLASSEPVIEAPDTSSVPPAAHKPRDTPKEPDSVIVVNIDGNNESARAYFGAEIGRGKASLKLWKDVELGLHGEGLALPLLLLAFGPVATALACGYAGFPATVVVILSLASLIVLAGVVIMILFVLGKSK